MTDDTHAHSCPGNCRLITLERHGDIEGTLSIVENGILSPIGYDVRRVYYLFDAPSDASRGGHSHRAQSEFLIAVSGSFDVTLDDGNKVVKHTLNRPYKGLLIPPGIWRTLDNFSAGSVCLVLSSGEYEESDYVRDYDEFKILTAPKR